MIKYIGGIAGLAFSITLLAMTGQVAAQNLFSPAVYVNDDAITNFELKQRRRLLEVLNTSGDLDKEAMERLIGERLQLQAAESAGIVLDSDAMKAGVEEFADRSNRTGPELLTSLASEGVEPESFLAFVRANLAWRELVRSKFSAKARVTDAEIDREIALAGTRGSARVLISEIFLPTNTPQNSEISIELAPQIAKLNTIAEFSDAARRFSAGPSRERGGVVPDWVPINNLPPAIRSVLLTMKPGQVTEPIEIPNALALFQLRALQETTAPSSPNTVLDYAAYYISGGHSDAGLSRAAQVRGAVDTCDDLYGIAKNQPPEVLDRSELALAEIPADVAIELAKLDQGEVSTALTRSNGQTLVFLMLCSRNGTPDQEVSREVVSRTLSNRRLTGLAEAYLDELRANAAIRLP